MVELVGVSKEKRAYRHGDGLGHGAGLGDCSGEDIGHGGGRGQRVGGGSEVGLREAW